MFKNLTMDPPTRPPSLHENISLLSQETKGEGAEMFKTLTMDSPVKPCCLHAPQKLTMEILEPAPPAPPKTMSMNQLLAAPENFFRANRTPLLVSQHWFRGGKGGSFHS